MIMRQVIRITIIMVLLTGTVVPLVSTSRVSAANGADWRAGNIVDDALFTNPEGMNVQQIQDFLNSKNPICDSNGTKSVGYYFNGSTGQVKFGWFSGGTWVTTTRAIYAQRYNAYYQTSDANLPFTCLKDYYEVPKTTPGGGLPASNANGAAIPTGAKSAAQLISDAAHTYNISPQTLLIKLHTESAGPLTTDDWPFRNQFLYAMGAHCPDSGPGGSANCDPNYAGFSLQMLEAAKLLRWYLDSMQQPWWTYKKPYTTNSILWNVAPSGCGAGDVYIGTKATAALYTYTPYQPNQAALNNLYGTGDGCSAYGNRNFWRVWTDWFGSPLAFNSSVILSKGLTTSSSNGDIYQGETLSASYEVSNTAPYDIYVGGLGICGRMNGKWYDFGYADQTLIPAKQKATISYRKVVDLEGGSLVLSICSYHASLGGWVGSFYPWDVTGGMARTANLQVFANPKISSSVTVDSSDRLYAGDLITARTAIKNIGPVPVSIGDLAIAVRDEAGNNYDFPVANNITVPANSTLPIERSRILPKAGKYTYFLASYRNGTWSTAYPITESSAIVRSSTMTLKENPLLVSSLKITDSSPAIGHATTATFSIKNSSSNPVYLGNLLVAARDRSGKNVDFPTDTNITIAPNETYTYSKTRSFSTIGEHTAFFANYNSQTDSWNFKTPAGADESITRSLAFKVRETPLITTNLTLTPTTLLAGQPATANFTIKNESDKPVFVGSVFAAARDPYGNNVDFPTERNLTIPSNSTYTYSKSRILYATGKYTLFYANHHEYNDTWHLDYPKSADNSLSRSLQIMVSSNPVVTSSLSVTSGGKIGVPTTVSFDIKNEGDYPANVGMLMVAARDPLGRNVDFPTEQSFEIPAHSTRRYSSSRTFLTAGKYTFFISTYNGGQWYRDYPASVDGSVTRQIEVTVL